MPSVVYGQCVLCQEQGWTALWENSGRDLALMNKQEKPLRGYRQLMEKQHFFAFVFI